MELKTMYTVEFKFKHVPFIGRKKMQKDFLRLREEAVPELNKCYEKWNEEYGPYDYEKDYKDYMNFIHKKQKTILDAVNARHPESYCILDSDPEESCDIIGRTRTGKGRIDMLFKEV